MARNKARENLNGWMEALILVSLKTIIFKAKVFIHGQMEECLMELGLIIKCREAVFSLGLMGEDMMVNIWMTKNMATAFFSGLMEENMLEGGITVSSTGQASTYLRMAQKSWVNGAMVNGCSG
jgi:hypothetical protein